MIKIPSFSKADLETYYSVARCFYIDFLVAEDKNTRYVPVKDFLSFIAGNNWVCFDDLKMRELIIGDKCTIDNVIAKIGSFSNAGDNRPTDIYNRFIKTDIGHLIPKFTGIKTCPYCNMTPIKCTSEDYKPEYDHYYPKSRYSYLVISAYNLIPCCTQCNKKKYNSIGSVLHPYSEEFGDDFVFRAMHCNSVKNISVGFAVGKGISSTSPLIQKAIKQVGRLALSPLYKEEKEKIFDIIQTVEKYSRQHVASINKTYLTSHTISVEECLNSVLKNNIKKDELHKNTFSKLHRDLCRQFIWEC